MKIKTEYILREVAGTWIVMPFGTTAVNFNGMITLNETGRIIWQQLEKGASEQEIVNVLMEEYDAPECKIRQDVSSFLGRLRDHNCLEE